MRKEGAREGVREAEHVRGVDRGWGEIGRGVGEWEECERWVGRWGN